LPGFSFSFENSMLFIRGCQTVSLIPSPIDRIFFTTPIYSTGSSARVPTRDSGVIVHILLQVSLNLG
jgi:hypothetical protein